MQPPRRYRPIDIIMIVAGSGVALLGGWLVAAALGR